MGLASDFPRMIVLTDEHDRLTGARNYHEATATGIEIIA